MAETDKKPDAKKPDAKKAHPNYIVSVGMPSGKKKAGTKAEK